MRQSALLSRIIKAAENLKIDNAHISFPEVVEIQILMWINWLREEAQYTDRELLKIQVVLMNYLEVDTL